MFRKFLVACNVALFVLIGIMAAPQPSIADGGCSDPNDPLGLNCAEASGLSKKDPRLIAARVINVALSLLGIVATILIIYAGARWMTAGGNEENVKTAQRILTAAIIGLVIILMSYAISNYVLRQAYEATTGTSYGSGPIL